jgi:hypothetical protein
MGTVKISAALKLYMDKSFLNLVLSEPGKRSGFQAVFKTAPMENSDLQPMNSNLVFRSCLIILVHRLISKINALLAIWGQYYQLRTFYRNLWDSILS